MSKRPAPVLIAPDAKVMSFAPDAALERWQAGLRPAALGIGDNVITMFDVIGEDFWTGGGVTAAKVASQLRAIGDRDIEVQINSPGGDMFEGLAIYNILREHPAAVTVKVMGLAASAASIIAMAGDTVEIGAAGFLMIHNCWVVAIGNRHDMRATADTLEPFDRAMSGVYSQRSGMKQADAAAMMDKETWVDGAEAVRLGLADALLAADVAEDADAAAALAGGNALRRAEAAMCRAGMTRSRARALLGDIKESGGKPGAVSEGGKPGAAAEPEADADYSAVRQLLHNLTR